MTKYLPPPELLRKLLRYDPDTGLLFWRKRTSDMFNGGASGGRDSSCRSWNTRHGGKEAFTSDDIKSYKRVAIFGKIYYAHRVMWALFYGEWPNDQIDHINGIKYDNKISNLRVVTHAENQRNKRICRANTSGITGVVWNKRDKNWRAQIKVDGRMKSLGYFDCKSAAAIVRKAAEVKYGFHANHGDRND